MFAVDDRVVQVDEGFHVPFQIHAHERAQLEEAWVHAAKRAAVAQRHRRNQAALDQSIAFDVASSLTLVGLIRQSIGPAINVMLSGCAG